MLEIRPIPAFTDNYIWLACNTECPSEAIIIDPGTADPVIKVLESEGLRLVAILITHRHWDHVDGIPTLTARYPVPVYGPAGGHIAGITHPLGDGQFVAPLPGVSLEVLAVPGHTLDHIAYYGHDSLLCGDSLFNAGCGRIFDGTAEQLFHSLQRLSRLPDSTQVYCAHEYTLSNLRFAQSVEPDNQDLAAYSRTAESLRKRGLPTLPTDIATQRRINPFLRCDIPAVQASIAAFAGRPLTDPEEFFKILRFWKDTL